MYSCLLFALFAVVSSRPLPRAVSSLSATPSDDGCLSDYALSSMPTPFSMPVPPSVYPSPTTDDCSEPTSSTPVASTPSLSPSTPVASTPSLTPSTPVASTPSLSPSTPVASTPSLTPSTPVAVPTSTPASAVVDASSSVNTGGVATYYYQNGNAGACGQVNSDSAMICAMDQTRFGTSGSSSLCGQQVQITNQNNGQTLTVTIADDCPTCSNENSIDLSVGAFEALSNNDLSIGEFPISWSFVN